MIEENTETTPKPLITNTDRLLQHLKPGTLAAQLVQAYQESTNLQEGLKTVLTERLEQARRHLGGIKD